MTTSRGCSSLGVARSTRWRAVSLRTQSCALRSGTRPAHRSEFVSRRPARRSHRPALRSRVRQPTPVDTPTHDPLLSVRTICASNRPFGRLRRGDPKHQRRVVILAGIGWLQQRPCRLVFRPFRACRDGIFAYPALRPGQSYYALSGLRTAGRPVRSPPA